MALLLFACPKIFALDFQHELRNQESDFTQILTTIHKRPTVTLRHSSKHLTMVSKRARKKRYHRA